MYFSFLLFYPGASVFFIKRFFVYKLFFTLSFSTIHTSFFREERSMWKKSNPNNWEGGFGLSMGKWSIFTGDPFDRSLTAYE